MYNFATGYGPKNNWATAQAAGDGRVLSVGWVPVAPHSALSSLRDVRYDYRVGRLVANPIAELAALRNGTLFDGTVAVSAAPVVVDGTRGLAAAASDVLVAVAPPAAAFDFTVRAQYDGNETAVVLSIALGPAAGDGLRNGTASITTTGETKPAHAAAAFSLLAGEALDLRLLVDRTIVEAFVAGGRVVFTETLEDFAGSLVALSSTAPVAAAVAAYSMGCGWNATAWNDRP